MSNYTHETVPRQFVEANGIRYAYRRFGKAGTVPLLFLQYFNANMDGWDPAVTNSLAADHEVILFDNAGVAASEGETPYTAVEMTHHCATFCRALGLKAIHVVGFSLGGMIAQLLALDHPHLVQRLILLGTAPRGGERLTFTELSAEEQVDPVAFLLGAFFSPSKASQAAGREYVKRLESRKEDRDRPVSRDSAVAQLAAIREWGMIPPTERYVGMALFEHTSYDPQNGAPINSNLADYVMTVNADAPAIEVCFLDYPDKEINEVGARGIGEIGVAGIAAAITDAVHHATGVRVRELPVKIENLLVD